MSQESFNDALLLEQLKNGNAKAFDCIYDCYWKNLFLFAFKKTQCEEAAKDLVQELFISLWLKRETLEITSTLSAYLFSALKYSIFDYFDSSQVRQNHQVYLQQTSSQIDNCTEESVSENEIKSLLNDSIQTLTSRTKLVFQMSRSNGYSIKEISQKLDLSEQTVKNQLSSALRKIRVDLSDYLIIFLLLNWFLTI
ncbi:RNA polymerase sigma-70 factor, ECF subfamily [Pseudarcicella hirudinis]|uniref:RNA polymerase sigma-70 factor, ECF subfamily n=1 Tax=Pseudarcicella hirudinis TaxID=1079859 RepID=A0A1I5WB09_9BACT|nr:RNA polymerase sigma-70 factor [Pseudarcicella hirudinis]SFQ16885.1 RNA polymerase sigma-70 factor, ECF subfamily [Pseudarcicella hirudinis]